MAENAEPQPSALEKLLGVFTEVKAGEAPTALLLTLNIFLLLTSYYIIKPVRDALITAMPGGPEYKSYMGAVIAVALLFAVPAYAAYAKRVKRNRLIVGATLFFVSNLVLFGIGTSLPGSEQWLPLVFYAWVGVFNMMVVAQFWAFANDVYTEEQGKRLFAMIGIGASSGAAVGGGLAKFLPIQPAASLEGGCSAVTKQVGYLNTFQMLLLSAALLAACAGITQVVHRRETRRPKPAPEPEKEDEEPTPEIRNQLKSTMTADDPAAFREALEKEKAKVLAEKAQKEKAQKEKAQKAKASDDSGAFSMVFRYRYLTLLAAFSLLFTLANTNGEYMISRLVKDYVFDSVGQCTFADEATKKAFISGMFTAWYGDFYFYVNIAGVLLQSFAVSRVVKWGGLRAALFVFPAVAVLGATAVLVLPVLSVLRVAKIAENSTDYSFNNTARNMLWLPTTSRMKYLAKQAVDTFFVRMGDVSSAAVVFIAAEVLAIEDIRLFAGLNLVLLVGLVVVALRILKEKDVLQAMKERGELPGDDEPDD